MPRHRRRPTRARGRRPRPGAPRGDRRRRRRLGHAARLDDLERGAGREHRSSTAPTRPTAPAAPGAHAPAARCRAASMRSAGPARLTSRWGSARGSVQTTTVSGVCRRNGGATSSQAHSMRFLRRSSRSKQVTSTSPPAHLDRGRRHAALGAAVAQGPQHGLLELDRDVGEVGARPEPEAQGPALGRRRPPARRQGEQAEAAGDEQVEAPVHGPTISHRGTAGATAARRPWYERRMPLELSVDVVLVGAGSSGAAAAAFLAERGASVAVDRAARRSTQAGARWVNGVPRAAFREAGVDLPGPGRAPRRAVDLPPRRPGRRPPRRPGPRRGRAATTSSRSTCAGWSRGCRTAPAPPARA